VKNYSVHITLTADDTFYDFSFTDKFENDVCTAIVSDTDDTLKVTLTPKKSLTINSADINGDWCCSKKDRILLNGYQSWTDTCELTVKSRLYGLRRIPKIAIKSFGIHRYGDYHIVDYTGKKGILHGFSYGYIRRGSTIDFIGSLNERTGYTIIRLDANKQKVRIEKDCANLVISDEYELFSLALLTGSDDEVFDRWFSMMGIETPRHKPLRGYTSWYNHYPNINEDIISRDLDGMSNLPLEPDIFQIDDGYQTAVGDWLSIDSKKFPNGLKPIVEKIHSRGMLAGLWLAPFLCEVNSEIYKNKKEWLLKDKDGNLQYAGRNWSGSYALDLENPEVRAYLKTVFDTVLNDWGFDFVKLDFLYAASYLNTAEKTRGQYMCEAMDFARELVGEKFILGCGVPLWPSFGKVDYCRIGCDVGLDWNDKPIMRIIHRERISTRNAVLDSTFRRQLDGRAFWNDPDVFLLRYNNLKLSEKRKRQLATVNGLFGSVLFMSDDAGKYDEKQKKLYADTMALADADVTNISINAKKLRIDYTLNNQPKTLKIKL